MSCKMQVPEPINSAHKDNHLDKTDTFVLLMVDFPGDCFSYYTDQVLPLIKQIENE